MYFTNNGKRDLFTVLVLIFSLSWVVVISSGNNDVSAALECGANSTQTCEYFQSVLSQETGNYTCVKKDRCDDNDPCTTDYCDPITLECVYFPLCTSLGKESCYKNECQILFNGTSMEATCVRTPKCQSKSACGTASCSRGICKFSTECFSRDRCHNTFCNETLGKCIEQPKCVSDNLCQVPKCDYGTGSCDFTSTAKCRAIDSCTQACDETSGECIKVSACEDNDPCTLNSCESGKCITVSKCDDRNICTRDICLSDYAEDKFERCEYEAVNEGVSCAFGMVCLKGECVSQRSTAVMEEVTKQQKIERELQKPLLMDDAGEEEGEERWLETRELTNSNSGSDSASGSDDFHYYMVYLRHGDGSRTLFYWILTLFCIGLIMGLLLFFIK